MCTVSMRTVRCTVDGASTLTATNAGSVLEAVELSKATSPSGFSSSIPTGFRSTWRSASSLLGSLRKDFLCQ